MIIAVRQALDFKKYLECNLGVRDRFNCLFACLHYFAIRLRTSQTYMDLRAVQF